MLLHTVSKSPTSSDALSSCLRIAAAGSKLLLLEDAVYAAITGTPAQKRLEARTDLVCYALECDVAARGLRELIAGHVTLVNEAEFVRLSVECHAVQSWY